MTGEAAIKDELHKLAIEVSGLKPLVLEVHEILPRMTKALETLATVTERSETNTRDHKHIHHRITENKNYVRLVEAHHDNLERKFYELKEEHIICTTINKTRFDLEGKGLWARVKAKIQDRLVEWLVLGIFGFLAWLVVSHLGAYPMVVQLKDIVGG